MPKKASNQRHDDNDIMKEKLTGNKCNQLQYLKKNTCHQFLKFKQKQSPICTQTFEMVQGLDWQLVVCTVYSFLSMWTNCPQNSVHKNCGQNIHISFSVLSKKKLGNADAPLPRDGAWMT